MDDKLELGVLLALIEDATKDTVLWFQANPSAEERVYVLAIQERLADLDRIIARRIEHRSSAKDGEVWSETVREAISLLDQARKLRGNIVGKGLVLLAERLPQELRGPQPHHISQAPAPPTVVGGLGLSRTPKPTQVPEHLPPYYSNDLKPQTRRILGEAVRKFPVQTQVLELCRYVVSELTQHFSRAVQSKALRADQIEDAMNDLLHYILVSNCDNDNERFRLKNEARKSDEWLNLSRDVARVAADVAGQVSNSQTEQRKNSAGAKTARVMSSKLDTKTLQSGLKEIETRLASLRQEFPNWVTHLRPLRAIFPEPFGYLKPQPPAHCIEIWRLEDIRERIILELSKRGKLQKRAGRLSGRTRHAVRSLGSPKPKAGKKPKAQRKQYPTRRGQNINRLRTECGWSFDTLAAKTGMDKKLILSHVNRRTKPHPRNVRLYADAFTKELGRHIAVADLEK